MIIVLFINFGDYFIFSIIVYFYSLLIECFLKIPIMSINCFCNTNKNNK